MFIDLYSQIGTRHGVHGYVSMQIQCCVYVHLQVSYVHLSAALSEPYACMHVDGCQNYGPLLGP